MVKYEWYEDSFLPTHQLCVNCAHTNHKFEACHGEAYSLIDNREYISFTRQPSHKIICGDCGKKTNEIFELVL